MYKDTWSNCYSSICSISFLNQASEKIGSGTGFKIGDFLITNNHVFVAPGAVLVELRFVCQDGHTTNVSKNMSYKDFQSRLQIGMPESSWDFAILSLDDKEFSSIPSLILSNSETVPIGNKIAILGYQFDQINLSIKQGVLSSRYTRAGVKYMQIDSSVNHGNSGGPLINIENNQVIGIITRKHTGLTKAFDDLIKSFDNNITALNAAKGIMTMSGNVDPVQALIATQSQLKITAKEIQRSSNVGIGYAYELDQINDYFKNL
jgi:hypothetical protein